MMCHLGPGSRASSVMSLLWPWYNSEPKVEGTTFPLLAILCVVCLLSSLAFLGLYRVLDLSCWCSEGVGVSISPQSPMLVTVNVTGQGLKHNELSVFWIPPPHQVLRHHCSFQGPACIGLWEGFLATSACFLHSLSRIRNNLLLGGCEVRAGLRDKCFRLNRGQILESCS